MFRSKARVIRYIFLLSLGIGIMFPLINIYYIYPSFTDLLIKNTENEAIRLGKNLSRNYFNSEGPLSGEEILGIEDHIKQQITDFNLTKLKIFSHSGEILYSSISEDIGTVNQHDYFRDIVSKGNPFTKVVRKDNKSLEGQIVTTDVVETYVPVMNKGQFSGAFEIYYDITERNKTLNMLIIKSAVIPFVMMIIFLVVITGMLFKQDKFFILQEHAEHELKVYAEKLRESNEELEQFANIASHDLQEPLRKVMAFGDRLHTKYADSLDERGRDYLNRMQSAAKRMQNLITSLLNFARISTKAEPFVPVDLTDIVNEVAADLEVRLEQGGGRIESSPLSTIDADPLQMRQLLQNLIGNALKFSQKATPPVVEIRGEIVPSNGAHSKNDYYQVTVEDNGIGFDEKYADRIFGVFQRLHGKQEYEGTGIGLSICRKIVERHNGTIMVKSSPGKGTSIIISLPLRQVEGGTHEHKT